MAEKAWGEQEKEAKVSIQSVLIRMYLVVVFVEALYSFLSFIAQSMKNDSSTRV